MKRLTCEMCGGNDLVKTEGMYVCQSCGTKYTVEEAKKMMIEGTVDVSGSTVKIDTTDELANLYQIARRARDDNNGENASRYYDMILIKDPTSWEASFYVVYFKASTCKIIEIQSAAVSISNCIDTVLQLIKTHVSDKEEQTKAALEVAFRCITISSLLYNAAMNQYNSIDNDIKSNFVQEMANRCYSSLQINFILGDHLDALFDNDEIKKAAANAWKLGINQLIQLIRHSTNPYSHKQTIMNYEEKIKKYDPSYEAPNIRKGCYVATAVYGSYDCPQVWTLRRYRDYCLARVWYGRVFIHIYYAISPTLVKWFGNTSLFKSLLRSKLDRIVSRLNNKGFHDTPYKDTKW